MHPDVRVKAILTVGDSVDGYGMVGAPDGIGAFGNGDGTFMDPFLFGRSCARATFPVWSFRHA
jgi:hypothetical protein